MLITPFDNRSTAAEVLSGVDLTGRRILITGGGSGLGAATARALLDAGAEITIAVRRPVNLDDRIHLLPLDLADLDSVLALIHRWDGPLDVLIANAGIMALPERRLSSLGWELQLATNYLGHFALAAGLRPNLGAGQGRLVIVSSGAHRSMPVDLDDLQFDRRPYDRWAAYGQSKTADVLLAVGAAQRWASDGIVANALAPGFINTGLQRHLDNDTMRALGAMDEHGNLIEAAHYKTPEQGASTATLLAGSPLVEGVTGRYFEDNQEAEIDPTGKRGVAPHALDPKTAERLWDIAEYALGKGEGK